MSLKVNPDVLLDDQSKPRCAEAPFVESPRRRRPFPTWPGAAKDIIEIQQIVVDQASVGRAAVSSLVRSALPWAWLIMVIPMLARYLLLEEEEEEEEGGLVGSYRDRPQRHRAHRTDAQEDYFQGTLATIASYSGRARMRLRRHYVMLGTSLTCASAVPVAIASSAPAWFSASLGAAAAIAQGMQQLLQDQRLSVEFHSTAVDLSRSVRQYRLEAGSTPGDQQQHVFRAFSEQVERTLRTQGEAAIVLLRNSSRREPGSDSAV